MIAALTASGEAREQPALPAAGTGQEAERGAGIVRMGDVQHRQHLDRFVQLDASGP